MSTAATNQTRSKDARVWQRDDLDWYCEPSRVTDALLSVESVDGAILDPSCGGGNIVKACRNRGLEAYGSDVVDRGFLVADGWLGTSDFLTDEPKIYAPNIFNNPPFFRAKGTEAFIQRALGIATRKVCIFTDIKFLAGQARAQGIWRQTPPTRVWIISERPSCPLGEYLAAGHVAGGGTADWIWLVWDLSEKVGETRLGWLRKETA